MNGDDVRFNARCAGNVLRYHTWPTIRQQTIADHTFHVLRIYYNVWPDDFEDGTNTLLPYILYHDMAEIATGDIPYPVKKDNPGLKTIMDRLELEHHEQMNYPIIAGLPEIKATRVKLCDLCEMYEFALHEIRLGNQMAIPIRDRVSANIHKIAYNTRDYSDIFIYMNKVNK